MGKRHRRAHLATLSGLMTHLLKWQYQPQRRSRSWQNTIERARVEILKREHLSPNLAKDARDFAEIVYERARGDAADETGLPLAMFPERCPYAADQLRDQDFLPG